MNRAMQYTDIVCKKQFTSVTPLSLNYQNPNCRLKHSAHSIVELCRISDPLVLADDRPICGCLSTDSVRSVATLQTPWVGAQVPPMDELSARYC